MSDKPGIGDQGSGIGPDKSPVKIAGMFDAIAARYDLLNTVLSGGLDRYWRRQAIRSLQLTGTERVLDVCTGTADVAISAAMRGAARVVGVDFSGEMLAHGHDKIGKRALSARIQLVRGDAMSLPIASGSLDGAAIAFGIRNVLRPEIACQELVRVLRAGGRIAILEFGIPSWRPFGAIYHWYSRNVLPRIGSAISGHGAAYTYLPESMKTFPYGADFTRLLSAAGFSQVGVRPFMFGAVYLYTARKGPGA